MIVFYYCYGSSHSSVLAAAIHVGLLSTEQVPFNKEIVNLQHYDKTESQEIGTPFFFGYDELANPVYIIGMKSDDQVVLNSIHNLLQSLGISKTNYVFINTLNKVNIWTRVGGFLSRRLGLVKLGRPLTVYGLKKVYFDFVKLVTRVKRDLRYFTKAE